MYKTDSFRERIGKLMLKIDVGDFLGFCDMNGIEALTSEQVEQLEGYVQKAREGSARGEELIPDAMYDRLYEILCQVNPESELCNEIWGETEDKNFDDLDAMYLKHPMYSIQTVKSFDCAELNDFVRRLPDGDTFDAHVSFKENGWGIRLDYVDGVFRSAHTRARSSKGRDITKQMTVVLNEMGLLEIDMIKELGLVEFRGEDVIPLSNMDEVRRYKPDVKSPFSAVSSMLRDSASEEENKLLYFICYDMYAEGFEFDTKASKYEFLEDCGFEVPLNWVIEDISKESILSDLPQIVEDCEQEAEEYDYYTDGLVFEVNDTAFARSLGDSGGAYKYCNIALKVGYWQQDMYAGYVQTILWMQGKTKVTPVAIVSEDEDSAEFVSGMSEMYVRSVKDIENYDELGVITASGNRVRRVPLYEPANMLALDAYRGNIIHFRYGGEAGVVPCYSDGTPLIEGRLKAEFVD